MMNKCSKCVSGRQNHQRMTGKFVHLHHNTCELGIERQRLRNFGNTVKRQALTIRKLKQDAGNWHHQKHRVQHIVHQPAHYGPYPKYRRSAEGGEDMARQSARSTRTSSSVNPTAM